MWQWALENIRKEVDKKALEMSIRKYFKRVLLKRNKNLKKEKKTESKLEMMLTSV